jgi:hypothetical protein
MPMLLLLLLLPMPAALLHKLSHLPACPKA